MDTPEVVLIFPACATKTFGKNGGDGTSNEKTIAPPLGILYLAAELMDAGFSVEAYDFNAEHYSREKLGEYLGGASVVGISIMSFNLEEATALIHDIGNTAPDLPIIAGGPDLILRPRYIDGTVATVCHEAETIIVPLVKTIVGQGDLRSVPGIRFRDTDGKIIRGPEFKPQMQLDAIKFTRRELLRVNKGYSVVGKKRSTKITSLITSRGCPKRCSFCAHGAVAYRCFRQRSAENVLEE
ncbi:MAG: cobalamin-dependent protein, partial [Candidatus Pacearchaeota archaeon]|nr:cobalamin-dependent protein [Candidatus Pacearchaeota archaeon]